MAPRMDDLIQSLKNKEKTIEIFHQNAAAFCGRVQNPDLRSRPPSKMVKRPPLADQCGKILLARSNPGSHAMFVCISYFSRLHLIFL